MEAFFRLPGLPAEIRADLTTEEVRLLYMQVLQAGPGSRVHVSRVDLWRSLAAGDPAQALEELAWIPDEDLAGIPATEIAETWRACAAHDPQVAASRLAALPQKAARTLSDSDLAPLVSSGDTETRLLVMHFQARHRARTPSVATTTRPSTPRLLP